MRLALMLACAVPLLAWRCRRCRPGSEISPLAFRSQHRPPRPAACRDRPYAANIDRTTPKLDRENAKRPAQADALMIYAVIRRVNGCDVLVLANDSREMRPLPQFDSQDWRIRPAGARAQ